MNQDHQQEKSIFSVFILLVSSYYNLQGNEHKHISFRKYTSYCSYATCEWPEFYVNKVMFSDMFVTRVLNNNVRVHGLLNWMDVAISTLKIAADDNFKFCRLFKNNQ